MLSGPAGIGKTRAALRLVDEARQRDVRTAIGHCVGQAGATMPYLPFTEILTDFGASAPEMFVETLDRHPALARLLPGDMHGPAPPALWQNADPGPIAEAVHAALTQAGREAPVLLVIEDIHWADHSTRDLMTVLMTRGFAAPVSIVATYRSDDLSRSHPLHQTLALWARLDAVARFELGPLDDAVIRDLVVAMGARPEDDALISDVVARAEGNPFFAEELCAACGAPLSETLTRVLLRRYEGLSQSARRTMRIIAAHGRRISDDLLSRVADIDAAGLEESLREAFEAGVLTIQRSGVYSFRHALLAEAIAGELLPGERARLHQRYAAVISSERSLATPAELERHAAAAGDTAVAIDAAIRAGRSAYAMGGPKDALDHYERALSWMDRDAPERDEVVLEAANAAHASGDAEKAISIISHRVANPGKDATDDHRARLLAALARQERFSSTATARGDHADLAYALVSRDPTHIRLEVLTAYLEQLIDRRDLAAAAPIGEEARALAARFGLHDAEIELRSVIARSMFRVGAVEEVEKLLLKAVVEDDDADPSVRVLVRLQLAGIERRRGRRRRALDYHDDAIAISAAAGRWGVWEILARTEGAMVAYELGEFEGALLRLEAPLSSEQPPAARATLTATSLVIRVARDGIAPDNELDDLRRWWGQDAYLALLAISAGIDGFGGAGRPEDAVGVLQDGLAVLDLAWGDRHEAILRLSALLAGVLADAVPVADRPTAERWVALARSYVDRASRVAGLTESLGEESRAWFARASADLLRLRWRAGESVDLEELLAEWRAAVGEFERFGHVFELARSRLRLAEILRAAGQRTEAAELWDAVADAAESLQSELLRRAMRALPDVTGSAPGPRTRKLTTRELEVLHLLARGRTNGQIASQLFISVKTASVHVTHILAKLGASSRGEAVALARDQGLL